jgi:hypothetical protein
MEGKNATADKKRRKNIGAIFENPASKNEEERGLPSILN